MAEIVLFHHIQGLTPGVEAFADELRGAGHVVYTPDLFEGRTFATIDEGMEYAKEIGFDQLMEIAVGAASTLPERLVYGGFSMGVMPAQRLAQTRAGARGALLFHAAVDPAVFGEWPADVPVQIHSMEKDPYFADDDLAAAEAIVKLAENAELFLYPGEEHLFADSSTPAFDAAATALLHERVARFLDEL